MILDMDVGGLCLLVITVIVPLCFGLNELDMVRRGRKEGTRRMSFERRGEDERREKHRHYPSHQLEEVGTSHTHDFRTVSLRKR